MVIRPNYCTTYENSRTSCSRGLRAYLKGTLRRRLSYGYFSFIAKYTSN